MAGSGGDNGQQQRWRTVAATIEGEDVKTPFSTYKLYQKSLFKEGKDVKLEELKTLLIRQNEKVECLDVQLDILTSKKNEVPISRDEVLDITSKLNEIEEYLIKILG